jgi:hypothetical protein
VPEGLEDSWVVIPSDIDSELLDQPWEDRPTTSDTLVPNAPSLAIDLPDFGGGFAGAPRSGDGFSMPGGSAPPPSDALAFYLPYHFSSIPLGGGSTYHWKALTGLPGT